MDPVSAVNVVAVIFNYLQAALLLSKPRRKYYYDILAKERAERSLLDQNYGSVVATVVSVSSPEIATQYKQVDTKVLHGGEEETLAFRQAITDESNMTAIAVSPQPTLIYPTSLLIADGRALSLRRWQSQH